ncbi:MAG: AAA family ATPase [Planctomycetaceae bacterium]|nr:AAA family ATPase [Planctomycetaceae bacterium]
MYEPYWQLDARPFDHSADERFYFPGPSQQAALLKLRYVLENRRGAALLAGEAGLGKTLLAQTLLRQLGDSFLPRVHLVFPQMPPDQLLAYLADQIAPAPAAALATIGHSLQRLETALTENAKAGQHAVIVIDEAQLLRGSQSLETIRLLLNLERDAQPLATVLLVGQTGLAIDVQRLPQLDQRVAVKCLLSRLTADQSKAYILHRLTAAGAKCPIFDDESIHEIHNLAHGIPRRINRLCDLALLVGYGEELKTIGRAQITAIYDELMGAAPTLAAA